MRSGPSYLHSGLIFIIVGSPRTLRRRLIMSGCCVADRRRCVQVRVDSEGRTGDLRMIPGHIQAVKTHHLSSSELISGLISPVGFNRDSQKII